MDNNQLQEHTIYVTKRNGDKEEVSFDKVMARIKFLSNGLNVNVIQVSQKIIAQIKPDILTSELDILGAEICINMATSHPDYGILASRILISNHQKNTTPSFSEAVQILHGHKDIQGNHAPLINDDVYDIVMANKHKLNDVIDHKRDYTFDYFGFKTLERSYLLRDSDKVVERPQYMWMRAALGIHREDVKDAIETYELMSNGYFTHATPTLYNAGTCREQLSSCFLLMIKDDSVEGIYDTLSDCALISQAAGGIGVNIHKIRSTGSYIRGTGGTSNGLVPMLRVYNNTARYIDQGGGKRPGAFAMYLEPHHPDIIEFIEMKRNIGSEEMKARDLFYAIWMPDLLMERIDSNSNWTLLDPHEFPNLSYVHGEEYRNLYHKYERDFQNKYRHNPIMLKKNIIPARDLWKKIIEAQVETGSPYILYKDVINAKNNQANLGTIQCSNLCAEITLYTSPEETAVCNLASVCLNKFVNENNKTFNFELLRRVVKVITKNLNKVIDINYYPIPEAKNSNLKHRPIGIGVQALADTFAMLDMPFDSKEARKLNREIAEHMYLAGVEASMEISKKRADMVHEFIKLAENTYNQWKHLIEHTDHMYTHNVQSINLLLNYDNVRGKFKQTINEWQTTAELAKSIGADASGLTEYYEQIPLLTSMKRLFDLQKILKLIPEELNRDKYYGSYSSFIGSPLEQGNLHYDLWNEQPCAELQPAFQRVKEEIKIYGLRNSTLFAYMPTASTSQIQGNNECFEPYTYNIYTRKVLSGEHFIINKHLVNKLMKLGMWDEKMKNTIIALGGSVQQISAIPADIRQCFKTVWEISQKVIIDYARDRAPFICQTQSMNLFIEQPTYANMTSMHFYAWRAGVKTGMYYLRTRTKADAQQVTIDPRLLNELKNNSQKEEENTDNTQPTEVFVCSRDNPNCESCGA
jgi:ribonucleoside-diphosphate reductase alpha subunit